MSVNTSAGRPHGRARRTPHLPWRRLGTYDWVLVIAVLIAITAGTAMIYSATLRGDADRVWEDLVVKQIVYAVAGLIMMVLVSITDYRVLIALWVWLYAGVMILLLGLFTYGVVMGGGQRWFALGGVALQPSELTKIVLILSLAAYFERHDIRKPQHVLGSLGIVVLAMFLVVMQPDLSTALLLGAIWLGMAFAAGVRMIHLSVITLLVTPVTFIALRTNLLQGYMLERIANWLTPDANPRGGGYQSIQTLIAVGNGGIWGTGYASGMQAQGGWLPLTYTDNIFALIAEELGFVGSVGILAILGFILWRVLRAAPLAQDRAGRLIVVGVATYLLCQTFVNIGVVLQIFPVTGLSLPLISYGGSSLLAVLIGIGLVQSVLGRRKALEFH
jgi:rod shape determining protein RodA